MRRRLWPIALWWLAVVVLVGAGLWPGQAHAQAPKQSPPRNPRLIDHGFVPFPRRIRKGSLAAIADTKAETL